ncbi:MAG: hypothetical protein AB2689_20495 [Candidatus Thiodiazotropha taylori]
MADYINKNILCQAYVHVEPEEITDGLLEGIEAHLKDFVRSRAEFFLYPDPDVEIELKDGSIKLYATIMGTITTLFAGVANYPEFREGAIQIYEDVRRLSDYIASESLFSTRARHDQVIRVEARTGVVGSVRKIVGEIDTVKTMNGTVYADRLANKLAQCKEDILKLMDNLRSDEDRVLVKKGFQELLEALPNTPTPPPRKQNPPDHVFSYRNELKALTKLVE